jgi:hypothetical protein
MIDESLSTERFFGRGATSLLFEASTENLTVEQAGFNG